MKHLANACIVLCSYSNLHGDKFVGSVVCGSGGLLDTLL